MDNIVVMYDSKDKVEEMTLYEFMDIQLRRDVPFVVCNVSLEDYKEIVRQVRMGYLQERVPRLDFNRNPYTSDRYIAGHGRGNRVIVLNDPDKKLEGKYVIVNGVLRYDKSDTITTEDMQGAFSKTIKVYTTESIEDIINHYMLVDLDSIDMDELTKEEIEMRLKAVLLKQYELDRAKSRLMDRKTEIERLEETPGDYFIKYSK